MAIIAHMPAAEKQSRCCWNNVVVHCVCIIITCLFIAVIVSKYFLYIAMLVRTI